MKALGRIEILGRVARVVPLAEVTDGPWRRIDAASEFPKSGKVFWHGPKDPQSDALLVFTPERNLGGAVKGLSDSFRVGEHEPVIEVMDMRASGSIDDLGRQVGAGRAPTRSPGGEILIWCEDKLLGPLRVTCEGGLPRIRGDEQLKKVPCRPASSASLQEVEDRGRVRHVLTREFEREPLAYLDWSAEEGVVRRALHIAQESVGKSNGAGLTEEAIAALTAAAAATGSDAESALRLHRLQRAIDLLTSVATERKLARVFLDGLKAQPAVTEAVMTAAARASLEAKLRAEHGELAARVEQARKDLAQLREQGAEASSELDRRRAQLDGLEAEAGARVRGLLTRPDALLAEVALIRAVVPVAEAVVPVSEKKVRQPSAPPEPPAPTKRAAAPVIEWRLAERRHGEIAKLRQALVAAFRRRGAPPSLAIRLHAAVVARLLPVVAGPGALASLLSYADAACGGRCVVINVSPTMLEPADLFGRTEHGKFVPHAAALLDWVTAAAKGDGLGLVILEGINRAPTEGLVAPLLDLVAEDRSIPLFHPAGVEPSAPGVDPWVRWPPNLRLAATVVQGPTSLPVSRDVLNKAVVFDAMTDERSAGDQERGEVAEGDLLRPGSLTPGLIDPLLESPEAAAARASLERFGAALARFESNADALKQVLLEHVVLPQVTVLDDDQRDDALKRLLATVGQSDQDRLNVLAKRLRRSLA
jgi:hypothetical protein